MDPAEGLHVSQVVVLRQAGGQVHDLVIAPLGGHDDCPNLLDLEDRQILLLTFASQAAGK